MHVWRIGTDTPTYTAEDLRGKGAETTGGRWNSKGSPLLYTASNISLACLETVVHLNAGLLPLNRFLVRIDIPDAVWAKHQKFDPNAAASVGWNATPPGMVSMVYGDAWLTAVTTALLLVPSAVVPEEWNALINPRHPDAAAITATKLRRWTYDPRIGSRP